MLGPFEVRDDRGRRLSVVGGRATSLLARLALSPGRTVPVDTLLDDLWDGDPPDGGVHTLRRLVSRTRRSLHEHGLEIGPDAHSGGYRLDLASEEVDLHAFTGLCSEGTRLLEHSPERAASVLDQALGLWRGTALGGVDADFARQNALRLEELRLCAVEDRADAALRLGEASTVLPELRSLCADHPLRERCHGLLVKALHATGRGGEALVVYEELRSALSRELGTDPSSWLRELHQELLRDRASTRPREWVNPYLTRFFGRSEELSAIGSAFDRTRLVTLIGPGGVGKTRLAAEYCSSQGAQTRVRFVELAPLREDDGLIEALAGALGGSAAVPPGPDRFTRVVSALSTAPTLLVLDNCEHLVEGVANLTERLLSHCPDLLMLTTSREPLAVGGEALVRVEALDTDGSEAMEMFAELAALARPGFTVNEDNAEAVSEICHRLDGLPLAIELAAARIRSMTVHQISRHLDERFQLLAGARRANNARHRTLRAVLDWTWDLLTEEERLVSRRLSILPGGSTISAAEAVCDGLSPAEVPYLLASLVDRSLVQAAEAPGSGVRHRLMETPRVYLEERLRESGEERRTRDAAARYFTDLAEDASRRLIGPDQGQALELLDEEHGNLVESMRHLVRHGETGPAARIALALCWYWVVRGRYEEAARRLDELSEAADGLPSTARAVFPAVRAILPVPGPGVPPPRGSDRALTPEALAEYPPLAMIAPKHRLMTGDHAGVHADAEASRDHEHPWVRAAGLATAALAAEGDGDAALAERLTASAAESFGALGDLWTTVQLTAALAGYRSARGENDGAVSDLRRALVLERSLGASAPPVSLLLQLGGELVRAERFDEAERVLRGVWDDPEPVAIEHRILCVLSLVEPALARGHHAHARELLDRARELLDGALVDVDYLRAELLCREVSLALAEDDPPRARAAWARAGEFADSLAGAEARARVAELEARVLLAEGDPSGAAGALDRASRVRGCPDLGNPYVRRLTEELRERLGADGVDRLPGTGPHPPM